MNYQMLKVLVESLIRNFRCPNCQSSITENDLDVVGAAGNNLNVDVSCPRCHKHTFIKAEVSQLNFFNASSLKREDIDEIRQKLQQKLSSVNLKDLFVNFIGGIKNTNTGINDKEILELSDILKSEHINVKDLFNE